MTIDQIIWFSLFFIITGTIIYFADKKRGKVREIFSKPKMWILLTIILGYIVAAFFIKDDNYKKAVGLGIVALLTSFFSEIGMMVAPFFLTVCFVMAFPDVFN
jgi:cytochrome bd-type quinol oxidase subunit 2